MFKFFKKRREFIPDSRFADGLEKSPLYSDPIDTAPPSDQRKFVCPACNNKTLSIQRSIELGADSRDDEYSLQAVRCSGCDFVGVATYQESRRGAEESWDHLGYNMEHGDFDVFLDLLKGCRAPTSARCSCEAHAHFGIKNEYGILRPLEKLQFEKTHFIMKLH